MIWLIGIWLLFGINNLVTVFLDDVKQCIRVKDVVLIYPFCVISGVIGTLMLMGSGYYDDILKTIIWRKR